MDRMSISHNFCTSLREIYPLDRRSRQDIFDLRNDRLGSLCPKLHGLGPHVNSLALEALNEEGRQRRSDIVSRNQSNY